MSDLVDSLQFQPYSFPYLQKLLHDIPLKLNYIDNGTPATNLINDTENSFCGNITIKSTGVWEVVCLQVTLHMIDCKTLHTHNPQDTFGGSPWHTEQHSLLVEEPKAVDYSKIQESNGKTHHHKTVVIIPQPIM